MRLVRDKMIFRFSIAMKKIAIILVLYSTPKADGISTNYSDFWPENIAFLSGRSAECMIKRAGI